MLTEKVGLDMPIAEAASRISWPGDAVRKSPAGRNMVLVSCVCVRIAEAEESARRDCSPRPPLHHSNKPQQPT